MTIETIILKSLDIFVSNFLVGLGWSSAVAVCLVLFDRFDRRR